MRWGRSSVLLIDLGGSVGVCALLAVGLWRVCLRPNTASAERRELQTTLEEKTRDLAALEHERARQQAMGEERKQKWAAAGVPPSRTPVEEDFRVIIGLARRNDVQLLDTSPLGSVTYPGVREDRYRVRGSGRYADLARMLREFENCNFWGDITYLRFGRPMNVLGASLDTREMDLTVSFYSAVATGGQPAGPP